MPIFVALRGARTFKRELSGPCPLCNLIDYAKRYSISRHSVRKLRNVAFGPHFIPQRFSLKTVNSANHYCSESMGCFCDNRKFQFEIGKFSTPPRPLEPCGLIRFFGSPLLKYATCTAISDESATLVSYCLPLSTSRIARKGVLP